MRADRRRRLGQIPVDLYGIERQVEMGDLLFAVVNLARWFKVEPESALREANARFKRRFHYIERAAHAQGRSIADLTLGETESLWQQAKKENGGVE